MATMKYGYRIIHRTRRGFESVLFDSRVDKGGREAAIGYFCAIVDPFVKRSDVSWSLTRAFMSQSFSASRAGGMTTITYGMMP